MIVSWFSAGVSSFIASYLMRDKIDKILYCHIDNQHKDSIRFLNDCESLLGKKIEILQSRYKSVENACLSFGYLNGVSGARCTLVLKKRVRKEWEDQQIEPLEYVWGLDVGEKHRAERIIESMPNQKHHFPLIEKELTKEDVHGISAILGIKRPVMYDLGYNNNNCVGCIKGGMGYWNKIRVDFPEVFLKMAQVERKIGASCIKGVYLDELDPGRGRMSEEVMQECGIMCQLNIDG